MATKKQERTKKLLEDFGKRVVKMSKRNLTDRGKVAGGTLHKSLGFELKFEKGEPVFDWVGTNYATFVDRGVSGTERKYNTPYAYKTKQPPADKIIPWITRKSLSFAIAKSIKKHGIKPTNFFQDAFNSVYKNMPDQFVKAFGEDMLNTMETAFKTD